MSRNALYVQSGGPTAVFNASAYGVISEVLHHPKAIGRLYAARYGTVGILEDQLIDLSQFEEKSFEKLCQTPSMAFGSCRYRMREYDEDDVDYRRYLNVLQKYDIGYLFLNGGNGTLASAIKIERYLKEQNYDCNIILIPQTVDNDIEGIDHSPGFPSAARHVVLTIAELAHDTRSYDTGLITVAEVMGRNTGWLAASARVACENGNNGPDLIYVPETEFSHEKFLEDVKAVYERKKKCFVVVAEGIRDEQGKCIFELSNYKNGQPGGTALYLADYLRERIECKVRGVNLGLMQRCAIHTASQLDLEESVRSGRRAVQEAIHGVSGIMVGNCRTDKGELKEQLVTFESAGKGEHAMPTTYIEENGCFIRRTFLDYIKPLIGEIPQYSEIIYK